MSSNRLNDAALAQLFLDARTANGFTDEPVAPELLQQIYDLAKMGPTSMNCQPARFVFLTTPEARERLLPYHLADVPVARSHPLFTVFETLLGLGASRITAPEVVDLLGVAEVRAALGLDAGDAEAGCTVHEVTAVLDDGPILGQARVPVRPGDSADALAARVLVQEHRLYPAVLRRYAAGDRTPLFL